MLLGTFHRPHVLFTLLLILEPFNFLQFDLFLLESGYLLCLSNSIPFKQSLAMLKLVDLLFKRINLLLDMLSLMSLVVETDLPLWCLFHINITLNLAQSPLVSMLGYRSRFKDYCSFFGRRCLQNRFSRGGCLQCSMIWTSQW
jgi:hypothetical protein